MTLRRKLLLVALCTLALPVAGWLYVRQMEGILREGQAQALEASAEAVARSLVAIGAPLPVTTPGWYVQRALDPITVDGYGDDWAPLTPWAQPLGARGKLMLAEDAHWLYLFARVPTTHRVRADADEPDALQADHLTLALAADGRQRRYLLASAAPGAFTAQPLDPPVAGLPDTLAGQWQEDGSGYQVELRLPRTPDLAALGVGVFDPARGGDPQAAPLRPLLRLSPVLSAELAQLAPARLHARLFTLDGWQVAGSGRLPDLSDGTHGEPGWLAAMVYRALLAHPIQDAQPWMEDAPRLQLPSLRAAAQGTAANTWRAGEARDSVVLATAVPVRHDGKVVAVLQLEEASRQVPLLANRALLALLLTSIGVLVVAGGILLAFATRLSMRLARLRRAAELAEQHDGRVYAAFARGRFPMSADSDEIGDLARSFEHLFERIGGYTDYLRTLASKLSHELNTPLAIVKSSLDNLEHALRDHAGVPAEARPYLARARDGTARLGALVRAMSEASRMERAIAAAEPEDVDLVQVVRGCAEGYSTMLDGRRLELALPSVPLPLHCAPELIAQALDKLVDNALSFAPADGWLRIGLSGDALGARIEVANQGPPLPAHMAGRLFDSLVTLRERVVPGEAPHLGLGLYVVRLVAERHGGSAQARNLPNGAGVAFALNLRQMPRPRL